MVQATWSNPVTAGFATAWGLATNIGLFNGTVQTDFVDGVRLYHNSKYVMTNTFNGLKALELRLDSAYNDIRGAPQAGGPRWQ